MCIIFSYIFQGFEIFVHCLNQFSLKEIFFLIISRNIIKLGHFNILWLSKCLIGFFCSGRFKIFYS